ncbi:MAG TPA: hypothetical protein VLT32_09000 [Candidatus Sulfomarinibacteraceae bacterium]|nr:hypothetical protein [Candidatus Sulfomarinibacteraceae bacterium]
MPLLRPETERNTSGRPLPPYRTLGCPRYGHRITWCRMLCTPIDGRGDCGRPAPHAMVGRTQAAIAAFKESRR